MNINIPPDFFMIMMTQLNVFMITTTVFVVYTCYILTSNNWKKSITLISDLSTKLKMYHRLLPIIHRLAMKTPYFIKLFNEISFFLELIFSFPFMKNTMVLQSSFFMYSMMGNTTWKISGNIKQISRKTWCSSPSSRKMFTINWSVPLSKICRQAILKW